MPHVNVQGAGLYYEVHGHGEPLVLLHNGLGSTKSFTKQMPEFSRSFRVVTYDRRGYGRSAHITALKNGWLEDSVDELSCFLDEIKVDRAHLCGICVGGAIALLFAVKNPSRVNHVTVAPPDPDNVFLNTATGNNNTNASYLLGSELKTEYRRILACIQAK